MERKYYEVEISKHDNRAKNGKRNETSMCIVGVREPSIKEAERFLADDIIRVYKCDHVDTVREISKEEAYSSFNMENENDFPIFGLQKSNFKEEIEMNRINIVMKALKVDRDDAKRIVEHLVKHGCEEWIDDYTENGKDEPLTDVHYEKSFDNMIDWQYEGSSPSEMLGKPAVIEEYLEMLQLKDKVIFWYGLV